MRSVETSSGRGSIPRARSRQLGADLAAQERARARSSVERGELRRSSRSRRGRAAPRRAARRPGSTRIGNGARNCASRPGPDDREPAGLAPVGRDLRDHLRGRDAERAREPRPRAHDRLDRLRERARVVEGRRDLAEVEVALVDPRLLDGRHDLAHDRPDLARVLAVERRARADEDGLRAAAQRLGARHRRADPEAARDVVRGRDDAAAVRVAADDERHAAELRALQLLDGGEERVQVEVGDDHAVRVRVHGMAGRRPDSSSSPRSARRCFGMASKSPTAQHGASRAPSYAEGPRRRAAEAGARAAAARGLAARSCERRGREARAAAEKRARSASPAARKPRAPKSPPPSAVGTRTRRAPGTISKRAGVVPTCSPSSSIGSALGGVDRDVRAAQHLDLRVRDVAALVELRRGRDEVELRHVADQDDVEEAVVGRGVRARASSRRRATRRSRRSRRASARAARRRRR